MKPNRPNPATLISHSFYTCLIFILLFSVASPAEAQFLKKLKEAAEELLQVPEKSSTGKINSGRPCMPASPATKDVIFSDDFDSGSFAGKMWAARPGENGVVKVVDRLPDIMEIPYSGDYALAIGREGNTTNRETISAADLCLNLSGQQEALLRFYIHDQSDETSPNDAILLSDDGGKRFEKALRLQPSNWADDAYGAISFDIAAAARQLGLNLSDQMVVRFQQSGAKNFAGNYTGARDGFFIDNVVVMSVPTYVRPPFKDGFESDKLGPMWRVADPFRKGETALELESQWGFVEPVKRIKDIPPVPHTGDYALAMGRPSGTNNNNASVNALDLHLDLSGKEEALLRFYLRDEADEEDEADGVYLSDDGGLHFTKALDLDLGNRKDGEYSEVALDIAKSASQLGLSLTDKFIVRIQQKGSQNFAGTYYYQRDGFLIDDLVVQTTLSLKEKVMALVESKLRKTKQKGKYEKTEDYEKRIKQDGAALRNSLTKSAIAEVAESGIDWKSAKTKYNADKEAFTITVENLEPFVLKVPVSEAEALDKNLNQLEYKKPVYALGSGDSFEVKHVEVSNPANGKTYVFDSRK